jgi:hypothetical protein
MLAEVRIHLFILKIHKIYREICLKKNLTNSLSIGVMAPLGGVMAPLGDVRSK